MRHTLSILYTVQPNAFRLYGYICENKKTERMLKKFKEKAPPPEGARPSGLGGDCVLHSLYHWGGWVYVLLDATFEETERAVLLFPWFSGLAERI